MANKKISDLTAKGSQIAANDKLEIAEYVSPGVYTSKSVLGSEIGGVTAFEDLTDTFTFAGNELETVRVNAAGTALETYTPATSSTGRFGIADSNGAYTYYTTLTLAMAAATSGQTIEFFTDYTETGAVTITLKDNVTINGKGHTYNHTQAGTADVFETTVAGTYKIYNLTVNRTNATGGNVLSMKNNVAVTVYLNGSVFKTNKTGVYSYATHQTQRVLNATVVTTGDGSSAKSDWNKLILNSCRIVGESTSTASLITIADFIDNCYIENFGTSSNTVNNCSVYNSTVIASGGGHTLQTCNKTINSTIINYANFGHYINCLEFHNCFIFSASSYGGYSHSDIILYNNCSFLSSANYSAFGRGTYNNCSFLSTASRSVIGFVANYNNCAISSSWNNAGGHALEIALSSVIVKNCTFKVVNTSANCIYAPSAFTTKYVGSAFEGATTPVNANITQGVSNTHDSRGNILI